MSGTTVTAIRSPQTNLTVVTDIMEYSTYGALAQAFVMVGLESYSAAVAAGAEQEVSNGFIPVGVWKGIADEVLQKLQDAGYRAASPQD